MKFIAKASFRLEKDRPLQCMGMNPAALREWAREIFKSGKVPVGAEICIYELKEELVDCMAKPEPPKEPKE